jgi:hypothetical protein
MADCSTFDLLLVDWLYDELEPAEAVRFTRHIEGCDACGHVAESLLQVRTLMRALPEEQPSAGLSARILRQAVELAPANRQRRGLWAWLAGSLELAWAHPAAAALATLMLVAGVAGALFARGQLEMASPAQAPAVEHVARRELLERPSEERAGATPVATPASSTTAMPPSEQGDSLDVAAPVVPAPEIDAPSDKKTIASSVSAKRARPSAPATQSKLRGGLAMEVESGSRRDMLAQRVAEPQRAPAGLAMDRAQLADERAEAAASPDGDDVGYEGAGASAEMRPEPARAAAPSEPAPTAKNERERAKGRAATRKADDGAWTESMHDALRAALRDQACARAVRLADDLRARDPGYYRTHIASSKELAACRQAAASQEQATKKPVVED